ncbi:hypothetical protein L218DRAFT_956356 [Marasmius fiardii PR-910]|nr:hypothetical protein L218DRAFT_956356 [Marasmius fiardii PR-910]
MPKKPSTPPPGPDEPRYFTVCHPYPLNANWELAVDQISCARWIAGVIGPQYVLALMYKPSARGMVLIEVDRTFQDTHLLLGEHRWKEILTKPTHEQKERHSRIFHSTYSSNRDAQKDGWKRLQVRDKWFKDYKFQSGNDFRHPYPQTHWCPLPPEDRTDKPMCRPLPTAAKPPPVVPAPPVVGSSVWHQERATPNPNSHTAALRGTWAARGRGSAPPAVTTRSTSTANPAPANSGRAWNGTPTQVVKSVSTNSASPANTTSGIPNPLNRDAGAWGKGEAPFPPMSAPTTSSAAADKKAAWGSSSPKVAWGAPNSKVKSAAATTTEVSNIKITTKPSNKLEPSINIASVSPSSLPPLDPSGSSGSSSSSKFSWADDVASQEEELEIARRDNVVINLSGANAAFGHNSLDELMGDDSEDEFLLPATAVGIAAPSAPTYPKPADGTVENLWAGYDDDDEAAEEFVCPIHGPNPKLCKKGICKERSDYEKKKIRKEKEQQKAQGNDKKSKGSNSKNRSSSHRNWRQSNSRSRSHSDNRNTSTARNDTPLSPGVSTVEEIEGSVWD